MFQRLTLTLLVAVTGLSASAEVRVIYRQTTKGGRRQVVSARSIAGGSESFATTPGRPAGRLLRKLPYFIGHEPTDLDHHFEEWAYPDAQVPAEARAALRVRPYLARESSVEMRPLRVQGPHTNRINLTILGDGYTESERKKFFDDAERTVKGLFETDTFRSFLPLMNVYAVFVPSTTSGIGDGRPKNTAFRLYRDPAGSKRAIMPGDERAMEAALKHAPATDYPVVLANDEYYGGLGGRWAISTSSEASGLIVLRHELGHNFGEVGEEYDNGYVYSGANASRSANVPWREWVGPRGMEVFEGKILTGDYVWQNLKDHPFDAKFTSPNFEGTLQLRLSTVGWASRGEVDVSLNGERLAFDGVFHRDRSFFDLPNRNFAPNQSFQLRIEERVKDGDNVLGYALAYAYPRSYDFTPNRVAAFASYDANGIKSYRPTHDSCLMRDMSIQHFCAVDQENIWLKFLARISLVDDVQVTRDAGGAQVVLAAPPLEDLAISWFQKSGSGWTEITAQRGRREWKAGNATGDFKVRVQLKTPEVRKASPSLADEKIFRI